MNPPSEDLAGFPMFRVLASGDLSLIELMPAWWIFLQLVPLLLCAIQFGFLLVLRKWLNDHHSTDLEILRELQKIRKGDAS